MIRLSTMGEVSRIRTVNVALPDETGKLDGLAYTLWLPPAAPRARGCVLVPYGGGSCKESHHDFARVVLAAGFAAICFDQRGHGESDGAMDGRAISDVSMM